MFSGSCVDAKYSGDARPLLGTGPLVDVREGRGEASAHPRRLQGRHNRDRGLPDRERGGGAALGVRDSRAATTARGGPLEHRPSRGAARGHPAETLRRDHHSRQRRKGEWRRSWVSEPPPFGMVGVTECLSNFLAQPGGVVGGADDRFGGDVHAGVARYRAYFLPPPAGLLPRPLPEGLPTPFGTSECGRRPVPTDRKSMPMLAGHQRSPRRTTTECWSPNRHPA